MYSCRRVPGYFSRRIRLWVYRRRSKGRRRWWLNMSESTEVYFALPVRGLRLLISTVLEECNWSYGGHTPLAWILDPFLSLSEDLTVEGPLTGGLLRSFGEKYPPFCSVSLFFCWYLMLVWNEIVNLKGTFTNLVCIIYKGRYSLRNVFEYMCSLMD